MVPHLDYFAFQRFRIEDVRATGFDKSSKVLVAKSRGSLNVLAFVGRLTALIHRLDNCAKTTLRLTGNAFRDRCHRLDHYTVDVEGLRSCIRLATSRDPDDDKWFSAGILLFLGREPTSKWSDQDRDAARYRLAEFSTRLVDSERLKLHLEYSKSGTEYIHHVILVKMATDEVDELVAFDAHTESAISNALSRLEQVLWDIGDDELRLAAVSQLSSNFLTSFRHPSCQKIGAKVNANKLNEEIARVKLQQTRYVSGISGGRDSAPVANCLKEHGRADSVEYRSCDTDAERPGMYEYLGRLEAYLDEPIERRSSGRDFDHRLKRFYNFVTASHARWGIRVLKLEALKTFVGDAPYFGCIGSRADEMRAATSAIGRRSKRPIPWSRTGSSGRTSSPSSGTR